LPSAFTIELPDLEFRALIAAGLKDSVTKKMLTPNRTRVGLKICGYDVTIRNEKDPDDWSLPS